MARFFLPRKNIQAERGTVEGQELVHLRRVLRLAAGDRIVVFDDAGWEHEAVIRSLDARRAVIDLTRSYEAPRESSLDLTLAVGLTKGDRMDFVFEKATELGVHRIVPFSSMRSVARLDTARAEKRAARWRKIAVSAAKQSGRTRVPEITPLLELPELIEQAPALALKLLFWEKETQTTLQSFHQDQPAASSIIAVVGPEGGFSEEESELAVGRGFNAVSLGPRILRAETAALTVLSLLQFLWGDLSAHTESN